MTGSRLRTLALAVVSLGLAGCGTTVGSSYTQYFHFLKESFSSSFGKQEISRERAAAIPFASLGYRLNDGPQMLLVLATDTNGDQLWTSAAHVVLLTHDGRILRTVGLAHNVSSVTAKMGKNLTAPAAVRGGAFTSVRSADFPEMGLYSVSISCKAVLAGREKISILGQAIDTLRADESCKSSAPNWSFRDSYWLDARTGFVWRSLQHLTPEGDTIEIDILRPPG